MGEVLLIRSQRGLRFTAEPSQESCYSAYELLIHHLSVLCVDEAQWWSRAKAYTNEVISPSMWGLMKVAGKRLYFVTQEELDDLWSTIESEHRLSYSESDLDLEGTYSLGQASIFESSLLTSYEHKPLKFEHYEEAIKWLEDQVSLFKDYLQRHTGDDEEVYQVQDPHHHLKSKQRWYGKKETRSYFSLRS